MALILALVTTLLYVRASGHQFVRWDDHTYITENPHVSGGLTLEGAAWAFSTFHASNWHPLTWLSHMLDVQLFGVDPSWHHVVNLLLHALNAALVFIVLFRMTGEFWKSALVAAFFSVHPLHVESVAWVSERKDLLSTAFLLLTLLAYRAYAIRPGTATYLRVIVFFALGLLAKPMLVTLPLVLLLLDYWPLGRMADLPARGVARLVAEKIPLLLLSAGSSVMTFLAQAEGSAVASAFFPFPMRVSNAAVSYVRYLGKTFCPSSLCVFYPHAVDGLAAWKVAAAAILLGALCVSCFKLRSRLPYLFVGWFTFFGTLFPVIGLVQVGTQAMADRYTYVPLIGVFIAVCWGAEDLKRRLRMPQAVLGAAAGAALLCLAAIAWNQIGYWRDTITLFEHALEVTDANSMMREELGIAHFRAGGELLTQGKAGEAVGHFQEANRHKPYDPDILLGLGIALVNSGKAEEAVPYLQRVVDILPSSENAHLVIGQVYGSLGEEDKAKAHFLETLRINPANAEAAALLRRTPGRPAR